VGIRPEARVETLFRAFLLFLSYFISPLLPTYPLSPSMVERARVRGNLKQQLYLYAPSPLTPLPHAGGEGNKNGGIRIRIGV